MRSTLLFLFFLALVMVAAAQRQRHPASPTPSREEQAQERLLADQRAIANLNQRDIDASTALDPDALLALWADDGVLLPSQHAPVVGRAALRHYYEQLQNQNAGAETLAYNENWEEVRIVGDYAFQWGTITARVKPAYGAPESTHSVHAMRILQRQPDGSWKIARAIWNDAPSAPEPAAPPQ